MRKFWVVFLFSLLLVGCSASGKPSNVSDEIWNGGKQYTIYINKIVEEKGEADDNFNDTLLSFLSSKSESEMSSKEREIVNNLRFLNLNFLKVRIAQLSGGDTKESLKEYNKYYDKMEKIYGKSNLVASNLDEDFIKKSLVTQVTKKTANDEGIKEAYMSEQNLSLTANEVSYNMPNNLDKPFFIEGEVKLCNYYNYGFTNEKDLFCGQLTPTNGNYSDSWYLYFHRESFDPLYQKLINGGTSEVMVTAIIPSRAYQSGQGNMARVKHIQFK
ncbi:hypothetical protein AN964_06000 [Heyndrickxia shackletonii]|uniref:Lipoprotein n=1 Tax=Heyndrickxia shackletonii TaxID=157838 RepID=A0A0Q3WW41_9BACI|nr:hypothetical protein [Heyndrickxia shackletonii]KQL53106.1 hypothetical protein AN964_06000 [Heyndrickxia shackletonii]NEZ01878.1 hypothetical protein [Heyndrickxia shackletonii]